MQRIFQQVEFNCKKMHLRKKVKNVCSQVFILNSINTLYITSLHQVCSPCNTRRTNVHTEIRQEKKNPTQVTRKK